MITPAPGSPSAVRHHNVSPLSEGPDPAQQEINVIFINSRGLREKI